MIIRSVFFIKKANLQAERPEIGRFSLINSMQPLISIYDFMSRRRLLDYIYIMGDTFISVN